MDTKIWNKEEVHSLLDRNDTAVIQALRQIFARQTSSEQASKTTKERNGVGFTAYDAKVLTDIASRLPYYNNKMTARQVAYVRKRIKHYWRQLLEIIEASGGKVSYAVSRKSEIATDEPVAEEDMDQGMSAALLAGKPAQWGLF